MSDICIGLVAKPQGIKGEIKIFAQTDDVSRFNDLTSCIICNGRSKISYNIEAVRTNGNDVFINFEGINDRNSAELLRGAKLYIPREKAVTLPEDRYFIVDLIGCEVLTNDGVNLGELKDIFQNGAADVYVVHDGKRKIMFPALKKLFVNVDITLRKIVVDSAVLSEVVVTDDED